MDTKNVSAPANLEAMKRQKMDALARIVTAGQRVLYNPGTREKLWADVKNSEDVVSTSAQLAAAVVMILVHESKFKIDPNLIIPAGIMLIGDILDFIEKTKGLKHTQAQVEQAMDAYVHNIMQATGANIPNGGA